MHQVTAAGAGRRVTPALGPAAEVLLFAAPAFLGLLLIGGYLFYIHQYGVNLPFGDEWTLGR